MSEMPDSEQAWDNPIILNPLPDGCICDYELHRTFSEKDYTLIPTRPNPECPVHLSWLTPLKPNSVV